LRFTLSAAGLFLLAGFILNQRLLMLEKDNRSTAGKINKEVAGFNKESLARLKRETSGLRLKVSEMLGRLDPRQRWIKKDYDLTIHFVEELGKANQVLREKAKDKGVNFAELEFEDKLPSEEEAVLLLNQLNSLREIVNLGLQYQVSFRAISPLGSEEVKGMPEVKQLKSRLELSCPTQFLMDFIIGTEDILPRACLEALQLKARDSSFEATLELKHIAVSPLKLTQEESEELAQRNKKLPLADSRKEEYTRTLRNNSPFFAYEPPKPPEVVGPPSSGPKPPAKETSSAGRFVYHGRGLLKGEEVAVIEDTLSKETVFLGVANKLAGIFLLKSFSEEQAVLKNMQTKEEIVIRLLEESPEDKSAKKE
jgi:hypothetical protein